MVGVRRLSAAAVMLLGASAPGFAQSQQEMAEFRRDCSADYTRLCSAYDPGSPQVRQCFAARQKELSPRCAATIAKYQRPR
jgi:hypothetical protein